MAVIPGCDPGSPSDPICVSDCGTPILVEVTNDINVDIPQPLSVCQDASCQPWLVEVTNPITIPEPLTVCIDPACQPIQIYGTVDVNQPVEVEVTNAVTINQPVDVNIVDPLEPFDVNVINTVTIDQPITIDGTVCVETCGDPLQVEGNVEIANDFGNPIPVTGTVCVSDCGTPLDVNVVSSVEVEIANDVGNPIPVTGTVCIDDCGTPIEVTGTVAIGCGPSNTAVVTRYLVNNAAPVTVFAANPTRRNAIVWNEGSANLFLKYGLGASSTDYTVILGSNQVWEIDEYGGVVTVLRNSAANQAVQATEVSCT